MPRYSTTSSPSRYSEYPLKPLTPSRYLPLTGGTSEPAQRTAKGSAWLSFSGVVLFQVKSTPGSTRVKAGSPAIARSP